MSLVILPDSVGVLGIVVADTHQKSGILVQAWVVQNCGCTLMQSVTGLAGRVGLVVVTRVSPRSALHTLGMPSAALLVQTNRCVEKISHHHVPPRALSRCNLLCVAGVPSAPARRQHSAARSGYLYSMQPVISLLTKQQSFVNSNADGQL